jgi:hypothetical protein
MASDVRAIGTAGALLTAESSEYPTAAEIATAVWGKELPGAFASGTAGNILGKIFKFVKYIVGAL